MLRIRDDQWSAFEDDVEARFVDQVCEAVQVAWPEACKALGRSGVRARVEGGVKRARDHEIQDPNNVTRFVHLQFALGRDDIDTAPETSWVATILGWPEASEKLKLAALEKRVEIDADKEFELNG
jgi:hypothetical protein